ncbi:MAG: divergent polysaccharide deacetylase family protein [Spirochaetia bacterium]|nr:divergent polysaccharide deacetylase family protein [Spirochaetia bacterium]
MAKSRKKNKGLKKNYPLIIAAFILLASLIVLLAVINYHPAAKSEAPEVTESPEPAPAPQPEPEPQVQPQPAPEPKPEAKDETPKKRIYLILDDGGHNTKQLMPFLKFPGKLSIAVIPRLGYSKEAAELIYQSGKTVMLHQPMQPIGKADPGSGAILVNMSAEDIRKTLNENLDSVPHVVGFNNHMGSAATSDERVMDIVLKVAKQRGLFFVDSFTHSGSVCAKVAKKNGMRIARRDIFLDNDKSKEKIMEAFNAGKAIADKNGYAVMIGHVWSDELASTMIELYPEFIEEGYCFESVADFFKLEDDSGDKN